MSADLEDSGPPSPGQASNEVVSNLSERREEYQKLSEQAYFDLREKSKYYGVPNSWLNTFLKGTEEEAEALGPIDTESILDHTSLCIDPSSNPEFVTEQIFKKLVEWYGIEGPVVERQLFMDKRDGQLKLETYPLYIVPHLLCNNIDQINKYRHAGGKPFLISALSTARDLKMAIRKQFDITRGTTRIWKITPNVPLPPILNANALSNISAKTLIPAGKKLGSVQLEDLNIKHPDILIEFQQEDGTYTMDSSSTISLGSGLTGLNNLGNTCYMNSALQCLVHVPELSNYFLYDFHEKEINRTNPLGNDGKVATAYAGLVKHLFDRRFSGSSSSFAPRDFKYTIGYYNSMFADYRQQDSQEFIAFLLDGLHEDLNRILKKPYIEKPELPDDKVNDQAEVRMLAEKCWEIHKMRNNSVVIDLFVGQYKSTLVCPDCGKVSITFDPYNDLTLPLPVHKKWTGKVSVLLEEGRPRSLQVELTKSSTFADLKAYVAEKLEVPINELIAVEVFQSQVYKNFEAKDSDIRFLPISDLIGPNYDVWFHQIKHKPGDLVVPVYSSLADTRTSRAFGIPFFVTVSEEECYSFDTIKEKLEKRYEQLSTYTFAQNKSRPKVDSETETETDAAKEMKSESDTVDEDEFRIKVFDTSDEIKISHRYAGGMYGYSKYASDEEEDDCLWIPRTHNNFKGLPDLLPDSKPKAMELALPGKNGESEANSEAGPENGDGEIVEDVPPLASLLDDASGDMQVDAEEEIDDIVKPLLVEKNALVCEWNPQSFDIFFTGIEQDDMGGKETWSKPEPIRNLEIEETRRQMAQTRKKNISLDSCLELFSKSEILGENDLWYCPNCKKHRQATKKIEIWSVPDILTIHLKRFENTKSFSDKIDALVEFPIEGLDLTKHVVGANGEDLIYDLFAVDNHFGGLGGGHYTAYAKNFVDGKWYYFDDSRVSPADPAGAVRGSAYLLFYRRRSSKTLGGEYFERLMQSIEQENAKKQKISQELDKMDGSDAENIDESPDPGIESATMKENGATSLTTVTTDTASEDADTNGELKSDRGDECELFTTDNLIKRRKKMLGSGLAESSIGSPMSDNDDNLSTYSGTAMAPVNINDELYDEYI
ncbi:hypothetical protein OGAPHI_004791 [Ogataea philodendri]|uniref:ubiquitinyl hydrolase 1 n=1 Tax=Ogataea philodendri TaxID=1378263 RepID=A0A9P8P3B4_9ASCO|nr:uncharacterized protein OGAPHI_004791 [Ogataea philodendri]KAH3664077.1 hypothetical protein OGAPHI_004791 [Ogataea philodendri]